MIWSSLISPLQASQNLWYITDKQCCLHGYIDEAKMTIVNVDTALYGRVYTVIIRWYLGNSKMAKSPDT